MPPPTFPSSDGRSLPTAVLTSDAESRWQPGLSSRMAPPPAAALPAAGAFVPPPADAPAPLLVVPLLAAAFADGARFAARLFFFAEQPVSAVANTNADSTTPAARMPWCSMSFLRPPVWSQLRPYVEDATSGSGNSTSARDT